MNNKPFIDYCIKSSHNSYIFTNYQVSMTTIMKSFFGFRNNPSTDNSLLNNHLINLLKNKFKFLEFDLANNNSFDTPIFIYLECNFDNNNYFNKLSQLIKTIFYKYLLDNTSIDYLTDSPFDIRFKNKIIFISNKNYQDTTILSSNIIFPSSNVGNSTEIFNFPYSNSHLLNNYSNTLKRVYIENILTTSNQPCIKNCNIFSINYLPNDKHFIEYNNYMKSGYILLN